MLDLTAAIGRRRQLEEVSQSTPEAGRVIYEAIRHRLQQSRLNHVLVRTQVFKELEEAVLRDVQGKLELITVASGDTIMEVGDPGDALFIVISGRLRVVSQRIDNEPTAWTRCCIRQADLVLILGNANASPALREIETSLVTSATEQKIVQCLVLLHEDHTRIPKNTAQWLAPRNVRNHYHLCLQNKTDFLRIARLLAGQGVGLVLSGGGARALAHIGVIRALVEKGVPIDAIGGVSGGAIVAGLWAMKQDIDEVLAESENAIDRTDYTLPLHALTSGKNWTNSMEILFGKVDIEDLWTSFFTISANLSQAKLMIHESGSLMHAVRASTAIPGILPPVFHDGDILVDGGLLNNLPTDIMKARPDIGHVFAIDVGTADRTKKVKPFDYSISGWKSLWKRLYPWANNPEFPSIGEVMLRSISITNVQTAAVTKRIVDLYLEPPVQTFGLLDFGKIKRLADIGYQYAMKQIDTWQHMVDKRSEE